MTKKKQLIIYSITALLSVFAWQYISFKNLPYLAIGHKDSKKSLKPEVLAQIVSNTPDGSELRLLYSNAQTVPEVKIANKTLQNSVSGLSGIETVIGDLHHSVSASCISVDAGMQESLALAASRAGQLTHEVLVIEKLIKASLDQVKNSSQISQTSSKKGYSAAEDMRMEYESAFEEFRRIATDITIKSNSIQQLTRFINAQSKTCTPLKIPPIGEKAAIKAQL